MSIDLSTINDQLYTCPANTVAIQFIGSLWSVPQANSRQLDNNVRLYYSGGITHRCWDI